MRKRLAKQKLPRARLHSPGPRTMLRTNGAAKTVVQPTGSTGFVQVRTHARRSHSASGNRNHKFKPNRYRVTLPKTYQSESFLHFSRRAPQEYTTLKRTRSQSNTFFSRARELSPSPSSLSRQNDPNMSRKVNFGKLCLDMLDLRVEDDDEPTVVVTDSSPCPHSGQSLTMSTSTRLSDWAGLDDYPSSSVGLHRTMSSNERNVLRPMTATMRSKSSDSEYVMLRTNGTHHRRPLSASASRRAVRTVHTNGPTVWTPQHHHPQILGGLTIQTSKGRRKVSKVLRHIPKHRSPTNKARRKSLGGLISPISTRNGPHLPVNWGM
jgi:hypothetical protein